MLFAALGLAAATVHTAAAAPRPQTAYQSLPHEQISAFQTGYDFQEGPLKGLGVVFQIDNLTNTPFIDYAAVESRVRDYETYGRVYFLGARYKL